jgi:hypothetical protein
MIADFRGQLRLHASAKPHILRLSLAIEFVSYVKIHHCHDVLYYADYRHMPSVGSDPTSDWAFRVRTFTADYFPNASS